MSKIFVLGYNKTGTKSLSNALEYLGYKVLHTGSTGDFIGFLDRIGNNFQVQKVLDDCVSSWAQFSILCDNSAHRNAVIKKLKDNNIPTAIYYITPLHLQKVFSYLGYSDGSFPVTEDICSRVLSLPMNPYLSEDEIEEVCSLMLGV